MYLVTHRGLQATPSDSLSRDHRHFSEQGTWVQKPCWLHPPSGGVKRLLPPHTPQAWQPLLSGPPLSCHHLPWKSLQPLPAPRSPLGVSPLSCPASGAEPQLASVPVMPAPSPAPAWACPGRFQWQMFGKTREVSGLGWLQRGSSDGRDRRNLVPEKHWPWSPPQAGLGQAGIDLLPAAPPPTPSWPRLSHQLESSELPEHPPSVRAHTSQELPASPPSCRPPAPGQLAGHR